MQSGESYLDVIHRLEPLVQEIERHREPLLIVGHQVPPSSFASSFAFLILSVSAISFAIFFFFFCLSIDILGKS